MKSLHILQCTIIAVVMILASQALARDNVECSVTIQYQNQTEISKSHNNSQQNALGNAIQKGCLTICNVQDIKSDCPQKCLKEASFSKVECQRNNVEKLGLIKNKKTKLRGFTSDIDEPPTPAPAEPQESNPVKEADINKAIHRLLIAAPKGDNSKQTAPIVQQETPLLFTKWVGNSDKKNKKHPLILDNTKKKKRLLLTPPKKKPSLLLK